LAFGILTPFGAINSGHQCGGEIPRRDNPRSFSGKPSRTGPSEIR